MIKLGWLLSFAMLLCSEAQGEGYKPRAFHVYSKQAGINLKTKKVSLLYGSINKMSRKIFELSALETTRYPGDRLILIDSTGGETAEGDEIVKLMEAERSHGTRIVCLVTGKAHSMAFNILTHCDVRLALEKARLCFHRIYYEAITATEFKNLTAKRLREIADDLDRGDQPYETANRTALKMSAQDYKMFADQDHIWRPGALIKRGYLHGLAKFVK